MGEMAVKATMRISASINRCSPVRERGFTLIEILLVLVVIAVAAGLMMLSLQRNPASIIDREARRLQAVLTDASDEAVIRGIEIALALSTADSANKRGYQLLILDKDEQTWRYAEFDGADSGIWVAYTSVDEIELNWVVEGQTLTPRQLDSLSKVASLSAPEGLRPSIILLSSGEMTPFTLEIGHPAVDYRARLLSDGISGVFLE